MKISEIAKILELNLKFDEDFEVKKLNTLQDAESGDISFLENQKYIKDLQNTKASAVLISEKHSNFAPKNLTLLISKNPYIDLAKLSKYFTTSIEIPKNKRVSPKIGKNSEISENVFLGSNVEIGENVRIMFNSYIGDNVKICDNSIIYPNVTIYKETIIKKNVIIHSGSIIGSDGFGFATNSNGEHIKIYQNGNVVIEDDVEIGANTTIDRAVFNSTIIRKGARIDNLVQIAHNCDIGEYTVLASQVGIAGSTTLYRNVVMGGQSGSVGHISIAPFTTISGKAGVTKTIKKSGKIWSGYPLSEHKIWLKLNGKISRFFNHIK